MPNLNQKHKKENTLEDVITLDFCLLTLANFSAKNVYYFLTRKKIQKTETVFQNCIKTEQINLNLYINKGLRTWGIGQWKSAVY